jgi:hypothetical protein
VQHDARDHRARPEPERATIAKHDRRARCCAPGSHGTIYVRGSAMVRRQRARREAPPLSGSDAMYAARRSARTRRCGCTRTGPSSSRVSSEAATSSFSRTRPAARPRGPRRRRRRPARSSPAARRSQRPATRTRRADPPSLACRPSLS